MILVRYAVILHPGFMDVPVHLKKTDATPVTHRRIKSAFPIGNEKRIRFKGVRPLIANNVFNLAARVGTRWLILRRGRSWRRDGHAGAFRQANFLTNQQHGLCCHAIDGCQL